MFLFGGVFLWNIGAGSENMLTSSSHFIIISTSNADCAAICLQKQGLLPLWKVYEVYRQNISVSNVNNRTTKTTHCPVWLQYKQDRLSPKSSFRDDFNDPLTSLKTTPVWLLDDVPENVLGMTFSVRFPSFNSRRTFSERSDSRELFSEV